MFATYQALWGDLECSKWTIITWAIYIFWFTTGNVSTKLFFCQPKKLFFFFCPNASNAAFLLFACLYVLEPVELNNTWLKHRGHWWVSESGPGRGVDGLERNMSLWGEWTVWRPLERKRFYRLRLRKSLAVSKSSRRRESLWVRRKAIIKERAQQSRQKKIYSRK